MFETPLMVRLMRGIFLKSKSLELTDRRGEKHTKNPKKGEKGRAIAREVEIARGLGSFHLKEAFHRS